MVPSFFLTSSDSTDLNRQPRACYVLASVKREGQEDGLLVRVDPPLQGSLYGTEDKPISVVVLANRHAGYSLVQPREWPVFVYVAQPITQDINEYDEVTKGNALVVAWGEVYASEADARKAHCPPLHQTL